MTVDTETVLPDTLSNTVEVLTVLRAGNGVNKLIHFKAFDTGFVSAMYQYNVQRPIRLSQTVLTQSTFITDTRTRAFDRRPISPLCPSVVELLYVTGSIGLLFNIWISAPTLLFYSRVGDQCYENKVFSQSVYNFR